MVADARREAGIYRGQEACTGLWRRGFESLGRFSISPSEFIE